MTFNEVLGLVVALEDLGFEVTKTGFSYKKGIRTWHVYVDIKMNNDWSMAYVSYDKYVRDVKYIADFFGNRFSDSTTVADVVDFRIKYGVLPYKKIK